jgi:hypothetical protein
LEKIAHVLNSPASVALSLQSVFVGLYCGGRFDMSSVHLRSIVGGVVCNVIIVGLELCAECASDSWWLSPYRHGAGLLANPEAKCPCPSKIRGRERRGGEGRDVIPGLGQEFCLPLFPTLHILLSAAFLNMSSCGPLVRPRP